MVAHKILISAALGLCVILLLRGIRLYAARGSVPDLILGIAFAGVGVGLGFYLRHIWPK